MTLFYVQLTCLVTVLFGNFISGTSPFFFLTAVYKNCHDRCRKNTILAFLIYFGGGVFMSTCFLNLQPRASEEYERHYHQHCSNQRKISGSIAEIKPESEHSHEGFPIPELIILCGFFSMFAIEELIQCVSTSFRKKVMGRTRKIPLCSCAKRHTECSRTFKAEAPTEQTLYGLKKHLIESGKGEGPPEFSVVNRPSDMAAADTERRLLQTSIISQPVPNYGAVTNVTEIDENQPVTILTAPLVIDEDGKVAVAQPPQNYIDYRPFTTYLLLALTVSVYNICQGVSIGHAGDSFTWSHLTQCLQQFLISFVIGSAIIQEAETSLTVVCYVGLLSIMCPLGISITMIFDNALAKISHLAKAILCATLCGNFLYLTFFDFLRKSTLHNTPSFGKFVFFTLGASVVAALQYISVIT